MRGRFVIGGLTVALLAACSGGGGSAPMTAPPPAATAAAGGPSEPGTVSIAIPVATTSAKERRAQFVSPSIQSVVFVLNGATAGPFDLGPQSTNCLTTAGVRTCTLNVSAPAGTLTASARVYDLAGAAGTMLATGSGTANVVIGTPFVLTLTLAPVVGAVGFPNVTYASGTSFVKGTPGTATVTVLADDPDGNSITGNATFSSGITLASNDPHITVSPALWTGSSQPITLTYDGSTSVGATVAVTFKSGTTQLQQAAIVPSGGASAYSDFGGFTTNASLSYIATGPDGNLWVTERLANNIARVTPAGVVTEFPITTTNSAPQGIVAGPDGAMWFTEENTSANKIGRITTSGVVTEFTVPTSFSIPYQIAAGPDGNLWFTEFDFAHVGRITPAGVITEFATSASTSYIAAGPDGNLWFTEQLPSANKIGRITPTGTVTEFPIPTASAAPEGIAAGPDGNLWFVENGTPTNKIGRITTSGVITEFPLTTPLSGVNTITAGADGAMYFNEPISNVNKIGRITMSGVITEISDPTAAAGIFGITQGPDNAIWFVESTVNNVGRLQL